MKKEVKKFKVNSLYKLASKYIDEIIPTEEIAKEDLTDLFYKELDQMIKNGEIIIININAKMRLGKSTVAMALGKHIWELLKKYKYRKQHEEFGHANIARDQQEKSKMMRDPKTEYTVIVTDESNELESTGENVTAEKALNRVFSDVQAGRYVHSINCSPKEMIDQNADIQLDVIGINKDTMETHCRIYYRIFRGGMENAQLIGHINLSVKPIIENWVNNVKKHFYKPEKTPEDEEIIEKEMRKDWYTHYVVKKHEKMELLTKEWITKPRMLDYAQAILEVVEELTPLCKMHRLLKQRTVKNFVKIKMREYKIPQSIIGEQLSTDEALGILELYQDMHKINNELKKTEEELLKGKINQVEAIKKEKMLQTMREKVERSISIQEDELRRFERINKKYNDHIK